MGNILIVKYESAAHDNNNISWYKWYKSVDDAFNDKTLEFKNIDRKTIETFKDNYVIDINGNILVVFVDSYKKIENEPKLSYAQRKFEMILNENKGFYNMIFRKQKLEML